MPYAAFHQGLHSLSKYLFTDIQDEKGKCVKYFNAISMVDVPVFVVAPEIVVGKKKKTPFINS